MPLCFVSGFCDKISLTLAGSSGWGEWVEKNRMLFDTQLVAWDSYLASYCLYREKPHQIDDNTVSALDELIKKAKSTQKGSENKELLFWTSSFYYLITSTR